MKIKYRFCLLHVHIYLHRNNEDSLCGQLKLFSKLANISTKCSPWGWSYKCVVEMLASLPNIIHRESSLLFKNKVATHSAKMGLRVLREIWHCWRQNCERSLNAINLPFSVCTFQQKVNYGDHKQEDTLLHSIYLNLWLHLCFLGGEPHWYGYSDAFLQHLLEGATSGWKLLSERPKGVQLTQCPGGIHIECHYHSQ